ncbi:MAG: hypothetical protein OHK0046_40280 [Anaerolineae bacterium]
MERFTELPPLGRFVIIQLAIFGAVALMAILAQFDYSTLLGVVGAVIITLSFLGRKPRAEVQAVPFIDRLSGDLVVIGALPLVVGMALAFV